MEEGQGATGVARDPEAVALGKWLQEVRQRRGLNRPELVRLVERLRPDARVSQDYLAKIEYGIRPLASARLSTREGIRAALGFSREEWEARTGLATGGVPLAVQEFIQASRALGRRDRVSVPVYGLAAANPAGELSTDRLYDMQVDRAFVRAATRAYEVDRDSLEHGPGRAIWAGDVVLVDRADVALQDDRVYVVRTGDAAVTLRRVKVYPGGETFLIGTGMAEQPLRPGEGTLIGRVFRHLPQEREV